MDLCTILVRNFNGDYNTIEKEPAVLICPNTDQAELKDKHLVLTKDYNYSDAIRMFTLLDPPPENSLNITNPFIGKTVSLKNMIKRLELLNKEALRKAAIELP